MGGLTETVQSGIGWLEVASGPGGAFSKQVVDKLSVDLSVLLQTPKIEVIVLTGDAQGFPRSIPSTDYSDVARLSAMSDLLNLIETSEIPVIAAVNGAAVNEGLELALAAHHRVAPPTARFAMSQISLGLIPAAGGTQRLPRLCGAKAALEILLNGKVFSADFAQEQGILDRVVMGDFYDGVHSYAHELIEQGQGARPTKSIVAGKPNPIRYLEQMTEAKNLVETSPLRAAKAIVECVEAAQVMPLETGLSLERVLFQECEASLESRCLRYVMVAEKRVQPRTDISGKRVQRVSVLGGSGASAGLVVALLDAGIEVIVTEAPSVPAGQLRKRIYGIYDTAVQKGRLPQAVMTKRLNAMRELQSGEEIPEVDAVFDMGMLEPEELSQWAAHAPYILTSDPEAFALQIKEEGYPGSLLHYHFARPPHISKVIELSVLEQGAEAELGGIDALVQNMGKLAIWTKPAVVPVAEILRNALWEAAEILLLLGAEPRQIDEVLTEFGFARGPLAGRDDLGLANELDAERHPVAQSLLSAGREGREHGLGYFRYVKNDPRPRADSVALWTIAALREKRGLATRKLTSEDILHLCIGAMANAGAKLVAEERVMRASDIDVLAIHALGFPRRKGGPMKAISEIGLFTVQRTLESFASEAPELWTPHQLINELVKYGQDFERMDLPEVSEPS